ncbi:hypothetical protein FisN_18Lh155 [Fistulifera solaris]|uniref:COP9 signalosome complex subunit 8 n=1 Tax=Fistulifera solaris TaxID=1519565 RepID=A0A1Z5JU00_FISSO|nr:hypothetical protein FisN_18Lh155 [Fistulifera solaris]|eukprot:GAX17514.1 hypothetical protein FisN_18Lh155 [Fistulifera solaris]
MEVAGGSPDLDLYIIHMAGLLYHQDWMAARHLFRRSGEMNELEPWFEVAKAALKPDLAAVWKSLEQLHSTTSHSFVQTYVNEISHAFRVACLRNFDSSKNIPAFLAPVLGFSTVEEMTNFARENMLPIRNQIPHVVAAGFLQRHLTANIAVTSGAEKNDEMFLDILNASSS